MVRMQDVAERANVSIATVSFVVNGSKPVTPATRSRVEAAMSELGFTRNVVARALATRRSRIIALLFPEFDHRLNPTALQFVHAAAAAAAERDHHLVIWPVANDPAALRGYLDGGLVDGVLAMEVRIEDPRVPALDAARVPFVLIGRTRDTSGYGFVDIDFETSTADALARLAGLGHERVALLLEPPDGLGDAGYGPPIRVEQVYRAFTAARGGDAVVIRCARDPLAGRAAASDVVRAGVTAVLTMNDVAATGLVRGLQTSGRAVPADVSVLGLAMSPSTVAFADPVLDYLAPPGSELGRAAAIALIDQLEDPGAEPIRVLLPCVYAPGGTLGPAPTAA